MNVQSDNYILIDYKKLAERLAENEFHDEFEKKYEWKDIYEYPDDSGHAYMKPEFQSIFYSLVEQWEEVLQEFDVINSIL